MGTYSTSINFLILNTITYTLQVENQGRIGYTKAMLNSQKVSYV